MIQTTTVAVKYGQCHLNLCFFAKISQLTARRHGDSHERDRRAVRKRLMQSIPYQYTEQLGARRHGDSQERDDPDHDRRSTVSV